MTGSLDWTSPTVIASLCLVGIVVWFTARVVTDLAHADHTRMLTREAWLVVCVLSMPIGGILYLMYGRDR